MIDLEIILVTYNRRFFLKRTLEQIFSNDSPIKDLNITILDNHSTDGTSELIKEYSKKFPNIKHIINARNIGGNANIAKAFEIAKNKYLWVLCDDDIYNWENWDSVIDAISTDKDAIVVANHNITNPQNISNIVFQLTFLPSCIYKTSFITQETIDNIYYNISNLFPHLPLGINIINSNGSITVLDKPIVKNGYEQCLLNNIETADVSYVRGNNPKKLYPTRRNMCWYIGYINSLTLLQGKNVYTNGIKSALTYPLLGNNIFNVIKHIIEMTTQDKACLPLYYDFFCRVNWKMKLLMIYYRYISKILQNIFSIKNECKCKVLRILGLRFKFRRKKERC